MNTSAEYYLNTAQNYFDEGQFELAEYVILNGIMKHPDSARLRVALSNIYYDSFRFEQCLQELELIDKLEPDYPYLKESFQLCHAKLNRRTMLPIC